MIPGTFAGVLPVASGGQKIDNRAMCNDGDSEFFSWTPGGAASSNRLKTISVWVKRSNIEQVSKDQYIFEAENNEDSLWFDTSHRIGYAFEGFVITGRTTEVFRDTHAWYHIVMRVDTQGAGMPTPHCARPDEVVHDEAISKAHGTQAKTRTKPPKKRPAPNAPPPPWLAPTTSDAAVCASSSSSPPSPSMRTGPTPCVRPSSTRSKSHPALSTASVVSPS